jgi:hypothetical protein
MVTATAGGGCTNDGSSRGMRDDDNQDDGE